jgi:ethanolamine utilization protein EutN
MLIGEVIGRLWASRQADGLAGRKLLLVRPLGISLLGRGTRPGASRGLVVAVDGLGAGPGERVIVAHGSRVRDLTVGAGVADKDVVIAIVDDLHLDVDHDGNPGRVPKPTSEDGNPGRVPKPAGAERP